MIDEATAEQYLATIDEATGMERTRMESELLEFSGELERRALDEEADHYKKLHTDPAYFGSATRGNAAIADAQASAPDPNEIPYEAVNRATLGYRLKKDNMGEDYYALRDAYANSQYGRYKVTEKEFYELNKGSYETEDKQIAAANELAQTTAREMLEDSLTGNRVSLVDTVAKWKEKHKDLVDEEKDLDYLTAAMAMRAQVRQDLEEVAPAATRVWDTLTKFTQGEVDEGGLQGIAGELARMSPEQRQKTYRYASMAAQAQGDTDLNELAQFAENLGEQISRSFDFLQGPELVGEGKNQRYAYTPINILERQARVRLMQLERQKDSPEKFAEIERAQQAIEEVRVVRELKEVAKNGIDPTKPIFPEGDFFSLGSVERGIYGLAGSVGYMTAAGINPYLGAAAYADAEFNDMMVKYPQMNPNVAAFVAPVSGGLQSVIDRWQLGGLGGRLPLTDKLLTSMKRGIVTWSLNVGGGLAEQNIQEAFQDYISGAIPLVLSHARADMPNQDPAKFLEDYAKQRGEVFWSVFPLGLIAGNVATFRDFQQAGATDAELTRFGFGRAAKDRIHLAADKEAVIREEAPKRTQADIEKGIALIEKDIKAAEKLQKDPEMPTLEKVTLADGTPEYHVIRNEGEVAPAEKPVKLTEADLAGKSVEMTRTDPATGIVQRITIDAPTAHAEVEQKIDSYSKLIDCLS